MDDRRGNDAEPVFAADVGLRPSYRQLFSSSEFRALFAAQIVSMLGTMVAEIALTVLVFARTGSPLLAALTFTIGFTPYLFGGVLLSGVVDRMPARRTLVLCELLGAVIFAVMTVPRLPIAALLALDFCAGLLAPVFGGTRSAMLPDILGDGQLFVLGRSVMRIVSQASQVVGYAVGGLLLAVIGARGSLLIDAASFVLSGVLLRVGLAYRPAVTAAAGSLLGDSLSGVRSVMSHGPTRRLLIARWMIPTCVVAPEGLAASYVHAIHEPPSTVGIFLGVIPVGMVAADLVAGRLLGAVGQRRLVAPGALLATLPLVGFAFSPPLAVIIVLLALVGIGFCHTLGLDAALVACAPPALRNRVMAVDQAGVMALQGIGFALWGGLGEVLPLGSVIAIAGGCGLVVTATCLPREFWQPSPHESRGRATTGSL